MVDSFYASEKVSTEPGQLHGFNIEKVLMHVIGFADGNLDIEALHLSVALHAISYEWNVYWKRRAHRGDRAAGEVRERLNKYGRFMDRAKKRCIVEHLTPAIDDAVARLGLSDNFRRSLYRAIENANTSSMLERLVRFLSDDLGMAIEPADERALSYRNELAHEGGFNADFEELPHDDRNERLQDVYRLRNLVVEAILRLCGFSGRVDDFMKPGSARTIGAAPPSPFAKSVDNAPLL